LDADRLAEFVSLVRELRGLGAVRVRDGSLEVAFAAPPDPPAATRAPVDLRLAAAAQYLDDMREELA
jgi:hypothetical protein